MPNSAPDPIHDGLGAFIPLDYDSRFEHAIVLIGKNWDSLFDLIYAPGVFVEQWRNRYVSTPKHNQYGLLSPIWGFESPVTIIFEPLTVPSPSNVNLLRGLSFLYPALADVESWSQGGTPAKFLGKVLDAISNPSSCWNEGRSHKIRSKAFSMQYIAEFALRTRTVTVRYIPRPEPGKPLSKVFPMHGKHFTIPSLTSRTINAVPNSNLIFIHFDLDLGSSSTSTDIAKARAQFALDFLADPSCMNGMTYPNEFISNAPFGSTEGQSSLPLGSFPTGKKLNIRAFGSRPYQPRLTIDAVWPDPTYPHIPVLTKSTSGHPKAALASSQTPLCVLLTATSITVEGQVIEGPFTVVGNQVYGAGNVAVPDYVVTEGLIKSYAPPEGPDPEPITPPGPSRQ